MNLKIKIKIFLTGLALAASSLASAQQTLLNVSYDVAREFYKDINAAFIPYYKKTSGKEAGHPAGESRPTAPVRGDG